MIEPFKVGISYLKCVNYETYSDNLVTLISSKTRNFVGKIIEQTKSNTLVM
jgi:hypothetical protein